MPAKDAIVAILTVLGVLTTPIFLCFYKQQLDILDEVRAILLKQRSGVRMISPIEFSQLERTVRGNQRYLGNNIDVLHLMFPKRYWFNSLRIVAHGTASIALVSLIWRVVTLDGSDATMKALFGSVDQKIPLSIVLLATSLIVYIVTVLMAFNQKQALRRRIHELSEELIE